MTREGAKEVLFDMLGDSILVESTKQSKAIIIAIKALEEQEFKITPDETEKLKKVANEAEKITKEAKCSTPNTKSCSYLLPCGMCDKTNQKCNLVDCVI